MADDTPDDTDQRIEPTMDGDVSNGNVTAEAPGEPSADELFDEGRATDLPSHSGDPTGEVIVPKRTFCERCEWFTDPPETRCTNEGTTIVELVDHDHFLVSNCPVVREREELAETTRPGSDTSDE